MSKDASRASPFDDAEIDLSSFKPATTPRRPDREAVRQVSEQNGFPSREVPKVRAPKPKQVRRRRTGRSVQINIKATQETVDQLIDIADRRGWVLGEVLEHALVALEAKR